MCYECITNVLGIGESRHFVWGMGCDFKGVVCSLLVFCFGGWGGWDVGIEKGLIMMDDKPFLMGVGGVMRVVF